jgi:hypothetical protein
MLQFGVMGATEGKIFVRYGNLSFSRLDDSLIAIDRDSGYCYSLNATGSRVWDMIATPTDVRTICDSLCRQFDVTPEVCLREVAEILSALRDAGLASEWRG